VALQYNLEERQQQLTTTDYTSKKQKPECMKYSAAFGETGKSTDAKSWFVARTISLKQPSAFRSGQTALNRDLPEGTYVLPEISWLAGE
jgi:hypothetical protein